MDEQDRPGKLVRDKIPEIIKAETGKEPETRKLVGIEGVEAILKKIAEEACELRDAKGRKNIREELGDFSQALDKALELLHISSVELEKIKADKRERKGGFERMVFMYD